MSIFYRKPKARVPEECEGMEVRVQRSACTGEQTIGFYDRKTGQLRYAELVRGPEDIKAFYERWGVAFRG